MVFEDLGVLHKAFGQGKVVSKNGQYITVKFESCEKIFVYPDIFEKFLTLSDGTVSDEIAADLAATKAAKQKIIDKKTEENINAMTRGIVIPGKENLNPDGEEEESSDKLTDQNDSI